MRYLFFVLLAGSISCCFSQYFPHLVWQRFYDNLGDDTPQRMILSRDGTLLIGGNTVFSQEEEERCSSIWIIKVDTLGDMIWEQEIALSGCEEIRDMAPTPDGGAVFVGVTSSLILHEEKGDEIYWGDYFIGKLDNEGIIEWLESYGGSQLDQANAIVEGVYREYFITGGAHSRDGDVSENNGMSDIWTLKIDTKGNPRFSKVLGGAGNEWATAAARCENGDYLLAGFTDSPGLNAHYRTSYFGNGLLVRLDQTGQISWKKTFFCRMEGTFQTFGKQRITKSCWREIMPELKPAMIFGGCW